MNMNSAMESLRLQPAIRGKIADPANMPVASARVVLGGAKLAKKISTVTGREGSFMFCRIPPGVYTLEVNLAGFSKLVQRGIAVQEYAITGLDMTMNLQEDSRALKLRSLILNYVNDAPGTAAEGPAPSHVELGDVVAELRLERALFNPPLLVRRGRKAAIEFGVFQSLKNEIMRLLLERKIERFGADEVEVTLLADLRAAGCLVLPRSLPRVPIAGPCYLEWRWELLPQVAGAGQIGLDLSVHVDFAGRGQGSKVLLSLEREFRTRGLAWPVWRRLGGRTG